MKLDDALALSSIEYAERASTLYFEPCCARSEVDIHGYYVQAINDDGSAINAEVAAQNHVDWEPVDPYDPVEMVATLGLSMEARVNAALKRRKPGSWPSARRL